MTLNTHHLRAAMQFLAGAGEVTRTKAVETAQFLLSLPAQIPGGAETADRAVAVSKQASDLADELISAAAANQENLRHMIQHEISTQLGRLGLSGGADQEAPSAAPATKTAPAAKKTAAKKATAKKAAPAKKAAAKKSAPATKKAAPAKKTAAKKAAPAKKAAAKKTTAKKAAPAKKTAAKKTAPTSSTSTTTSTQTPPSGATEGQA